MASGYHSLIDIYAAIVVVTGLAGAALGLPNLDRAAAAIVAVMIFLSGYQIAASAIAALGQRRAIDLEGEAGHAHMPSRGWWRIYGPVAGALLVAIYLLSGFYTIAPGEKAVVRRFGVVVEESGPGLHYRLPAPIERVDVVAVDQVRRMVMPQMQMLSGDENLVSVRASLHFVVSDPAAFVLAVANPEDLVFQAGTAALRQAVASEAVDALLTVDKAAIEKRTADAMQVALDRNRSGLRIVGVQLLESVPPPEVAEAFRDVASARRPQHLRQRGARLSQRSPAAGARRGRQDDPGGQCLSRRQDGACHRRGDKLPGAPDRLCRSARHHAPETLPGGDGNGAYRRLQADRRSDGLSADDRSLAQAAGRRQDVSAGTITLGIKFR